MDSRQQNRSGRPAVEQRRPGDPLCLRNECFGLCVGSETEASVIFLIRHTLYQEGVRRNVCLIVAKLEGLREVSEPQILPRRYRSDPLEGGLS